MECFRTRVQLPPPPPLPQKPVPRPARSPDGFSFFRGWLFLQNPKVLSNRSVPWQNHHELYAAHRRANGIVATDPARPASLSKGVGAQKQTQLTASAEAVHTVLYGIGDQLGPGMVNHELQRTAGPDRFRGAGQAGNAVGDRMSIERAGGGFLEAAQFAPAHQSTKRRHRCNSSSRPNPVSSNSSRQRFGNDW